MLKYEYFAEVSWLQMQQAAGLLSACGLYQISAGGPRMAITRCRLHSSNYAVSEQVVKPREPLGEPLSSALADRRVRSQCLVSSLASDVAFRETVQC